MTARSDERGPTFTPQDVAEFMVSELDRSRYLYQDEVVYKIARKFGDQFIYLNENGNRAIDKKVLQAFRKLTEGQVVWERGQRMWRRREKYDGAGRQ